MKELPTACSSLEAMASGPVSKTFPHLCEVPHNMAQRIWGSTLGSPSLSPASVGVRMLRTIVLGRNGCKGSGLMEIEIVVGSYPELWAKFWVFSGFEGLRFRAIRF